MTFVYVLVPQSLFTAEQDCRRRFFVCLNDMPFSKNVSLGQKPYYFVAFNNYAYFCKHQTDAERRTISIFFRFLS